MAEFSLASGSQSSGQGGGVEWYESAGRSDYSFDTPGPSSSAATYGTFEDEPPLLEELGIDITGILQRSTCIASSRTRNLNLEDLDMGGPLIFVLVLACIHLLTGKLHFGVILGWSVVSSIVVWLVVNNMAGTENPESQSLGLYSCCCLLGYCLLPMVVFALLALIIPRGIANVILASVTTLWCGQTAAKLFVKKAPSISDQTLLRNFEMTDQNNSDNFSFGPFRNAAKTEKENRSPTRRDTAEARRGSKQSRVRFAQGAVGDTSSPISANTIPPADASSTSLPASTPLNSGSAASVDADAVATPVGGIGMPTPAGPMGRGVSLPPTPFAPQSMTPGSSVFASFVAPAWRSRTSNAAFKGRSPSSSRHSSPASSSGMPEYTSPLVSSASRHPFFTDMLASMSTPNMSSSPLTSPGGRPLGRGLDDSPAISGTSGDSRRTSPLDSGEVVSGVRAASVSPSSTPGDATAISKGISTGSVSRLAPQAASEASQQDSLPATGFGPSIGPATSATAQSNDTEPHAPDVSNSVTETLLQQSSELPSQVYSGTPDQTSTPELISSMPDQASTPRLNRGLPDQATTPHLKTRLPELEMLSHIPKGGPVRGVSATPKTAGAREYGSWWTPKGLTPAWLKTRTPGWMKKMQQPDLDEEMVQPKRLDLRPLTPFLKPKPQPKLDDPAQQDEEEVPQVQQRPVAAKSTTQIFLPILVRLVIFIGAAFGSWRSYGSLPMMQLYHHQTDHSLGNTVPYMWSGGPLTGSLELPFTYASDMLPWIALGIDSHHAFHPKGRPPVPSKEDIRQSFEFAQQQPPQEVDTQFGHAAVDALHAEMQKALDPSAGMRESVDTARRIGQSDLGIGFDSEHAVQDSGTDSEQSSTDTEGDRDKTASHTASPVDSTNGADLSTASSTQYVSTTKAAVADKSGRLLSWPQRSCSASEEESDLSSDAHPAQGLADASAQLMQSLDNLLGSLEVPTQDTPDHAALQQQQQEQQQQRDDDHEWVANQQRLQADAEPEVELLGRASPAEEDSNVNMARADHHAAPSDKDMTVKSLNRTLWPLAALLVATAGVGLLLRLLRRSPEEHEEYDDDAEEASDSPSVSRRLDSSFANSGARPSQSGTVSNAADPLAGVSDLPPAGPVPNSPEEGPRASFSQRVTRNVQRALSHNGGQTPARHPAQFPASTSPAVLQGLANAGPSSQPGSRSTVRRSTRLHSHTAAQPILESQEEVNSLKLGRRSGRQRRYAQRNV
ncbi:hypothetical protein WJX82_010954 [Trebouxia sp. C0006]